MFVPSFKYYVNTPQGIMSICIYMYTHKHTTKSFLFWNRIQIDGMFKCLKNSQHGYLNHATPWALISSHVTTVLDS